MSKQIANYDQLKNVYVFMDEDKNMVVINSSIVEQCVDQKRAANAWITKESNDYHEAFTNGGNE